MAVRLDIRPRLRLAPDWQPGPAAPRRRLPPLAMPALAYWAGMAALTYGFTQLGPHPLDEAFAAESAANAAAPAPLPPPSLPPSPPAEAAPAAAASPAAAETSLPEPPPTTPERLAEALPTAEPPQEERRAPRGPSAPAAAQATAEVTRASPTAALSFPEFTDSSPTPPRERAAEGPRLDSLFERDPSSTVLPEEPPPPSAARAPSPSVPLLSCEAAVARNEERLEIGGPRGPADITREAYASILQNGSYLGACQVPERTVLEICAAVKHGRAVGVTVTTAPPRAELAACVRRAVSRLSFPASERLDVTHTRFDAARR